MGNEFIPVCLGLFFGGFALAYGGYSLEPTHHFSPILSYVFGGGCVASAIVLAALRIAQPRRFIEAPNPEAVRVPANPNSTDEAGLAHDEIRFDCLPDSPLKAGWQVAYGDAASARWLLASDAPTPGSVLIEMSKGSAIDYRLSPGAALSSRLIFEIKFTETTVLYIRVQLASPDPSRSEEKWIEYVLGKQPPSPTRGYEKDEWTLPVNPRPLPNDWRRFEISLPADVARTWGQQGWTFKCLKVIRLCGTVSISPIRLYSGDDGA